VLAGSSGTGIHSGRVSEPAVLATAGAVAPPAPDSVGSLNTATVRTLPGGILEIGFAPGSTLTALLVKQVFAAAALSAEPKGAPAHVLVDVSGLDGVDPHAACALGVSAIISRIVFLGSGPADRVTTRFVTADLPPGTDFRYVQDRDEALRYLERNA